MSNAKTFDQCMMWIREQFPFTYADHLVKRLTVFNPNLFAEVTLFPSLRNNRCAICRIDKSKVDWAHLGFAGQVLGNQLGFQPIVLSEVMEGGFVLVSHQQMFAVNDKLKRKFNNDFGLKEIDYVAEECERVRLGGSNSG